MFRSHVAESLSVTDAELCQSLLHAIAGTPTAVPWAAVAIHPAGCLLLWDDREDATSLILEAIASESGDVLATTSIERGPNRRPMIGVLVRPRESGLDAAAAHLRTQYALATTSADDDAASGPF